MNAQKFVFGLENEKGFAKVFDQKKFTGQYVNTFELVNYIEKELNKKCLYGFIKFYLDKTINYVAYYKQDSIMDKEKIIILLPNIPNTYNPEIKILDEFVDVILNLTLSNYNRIKKMKNVVLITFVTIKTAHGLKK